MRNSLVKTKWMGLLLIWTFSISVMAQQRELSGKVTDADDNSPIPGVNIIIKGTSTGTITDFDGNFKIEIAESDVLIFSYVGYLPQEVTVGTNENLNILLEASDVGIDEVVVIGYGQVRKEDATGALLSVSEKDFNKGAITSPQELLTGKVSGVQITSEGGAPDSKMNIRIRGGASLTASNDPLIVIDGVPVDNDDVSGMSNPLNTINPNDIESFTVLKDASATAIYGSRASNGVILITTKKGSKGGLKLSYAGNFSIGFTTNEIDVLSDEEYRNLIVDRYGDGSTPAGLLGNSSTNWQKEIFQTAIGHDHSLSLSNATKNIPYRVSFGYSNKKGILKTSKLDRFTGAINVNPTFFDNQLKFDLNLKGVAIKNTFATTDAIGNALLYDPTKEVYDSGNNYGGYNTWMDGTIPASFAPVNPVAQLNQRADKSDVMRSIGNLKTVYDLPFLPDLTATLNLGYDYTFAEGTLMIPENAAFEYRTASDGHDQSGEDRIYTQDKKNQLLDFYLNYSKELSNIQSKIDVMGGYSWQHFWRSNYVFATSINEEYLIAPANWDPTENYMVSFFGRLNYTLKDRYLFTATVRRDGTSRFSPDNRWGTFPSMALAWRIDQESFMENFNALSTMKVRIGYGVTGQQYITSDNYPYLARYSYSQSTARYPFGSEWVTMARAAGYDANLKWEESTTYNLGLDFGFINDRISGSLEIYKRETKDLINEIPTAAGTNFTNLILTNVGALENKGVEFNLNASIIAKKDLTWDLSLNFTQNINEITKLTAVEDPSYAGAQIGRISIGTGNYIKINSVGKPANSFYVRQQVYDQKGMPIEGVYVDRNDDGTINEDDLYHFNSSAPNYLLGVSSRVTYKNWEFSFSGRANIGNYVYAEYEAGNANYQYVYNAPYIQNLPQAVFNSNFESQQELSDYYVRDASFFRMDNISLAYRFEGLFNDKVNLGLSLTAQNVFVITDYTGLDPEVFDGLDNNIYPRPTTIIFGLNLDF